MEYFEVSIPFNAELCITCLPVLEYEGFIYTASWSGPQPGDKNYTESRVNKS